MRHFEVPCMAAAWLDGRRHPRAACPTSGSGQSSDRPGSVAVDETARAVSASPSDSRDGVGVLLVNHGSHSPTWRSMLLDVHDSVADHLLAIPGVTQVRTAFMEYTEPCIATQLRALDEAGVRAVVVVSLLLTISDHTFDDIPVICGLSSDPQTIAKLAKDKIEIYQASAELRFVPLLDFSGLAKTSLARRVRAVLGRRPDAGRNRTRDGLVLVGYGSAEFEDDWDRFFMEMRNFAENELGLTPTAHAWCGHIAGYRRQPTIEAIARVLDRADRAVLIPMLVAHDEMFQDRIIGGAVSRCRDPDRVLYRPDAILPEPEVGRWVVESVRRTLSALPGSTTTTRTSTR